MQLDHELNFGLNKYSTYIKFKNDVEKSRKKIVLLTSDPLLLSQIKIPINKKRFIHLSFQKPFSAKNKDT